MSEIRPLWTVIELGDHLGYSPKTIATMLSRSPDKLPPRVSALSKPRWDPEAVVLWVAQHSRPSLVRRGGRPRNPPIQVSSPGR